MNHKHLFIDLDSHDAAVGFELSRKLGDAAPEEISMTFPDMCGAFAAAKLWRRLWGEQTN